MISALLARLIWFLSHLFCFDVVMEVGVDLKKPEPGDQWEEWVPNKKRYLQLGWIKTRVAPEFLTTMNREFDKRWRRKFDMERLKG